MNETTDPKRNRPSSEGRDNDPNIRDDSAFQPGIQTNSPSGTDDENNHVTKSAMDGGGAPTQFDLDSDADPAFDDIEKDI